MFADDLLVLIPSPEGIRAFGLIKTTLPGVERESLQQKVQYHYKWSKQKQEHFQT